MRKILLIAACLPAALLAGCSNKTPLTEDAKPISGPAPRLNSTPMAVALACLRNQRSNDLRVGVSDFVDGTGVMEGGTQNSRALSQRPDMMMVVALANSGAKLVNRSSVNVAEWEMGKAMEKKLGDGRPTLIEQQSVDYRPIKTGVLLGSTHYVTGAITELNWNIESGVAEAGAYSASVGRRTYRIGIAVDVVVTDTRTTEIVHARSYKKQLVGVETNANFFRFVSNNSMLNAVTNGTATSANITQAMELFNANLGERQNEPVQTALRWVIELAAYDVMRNLKHTGSDCDQLLPPDSMDVAPEVAPKAPLKTQRNAEYSFEEPKSVAKVEAKAPVFAKEPAIADLPVKAKKPEKAAKVETAPLPQFKAATVASASESKVSTVAKSSKAAQTADAVEAPAVDAYGALPTRLKSAENTMPVMAGASAPLAANFTPTTAK